MTLSSEPLSEAASVSVESGELMVRSMSSHLDSPVAIARVRKTNSAATAKFCLVSSHSLQLVLSYRGKQARAFWPTRAITNSAFLCFRISTFPRFHISHSRFLVTPTHHQLLVMQYIQRCGKGGSDKKGNGKWGNGKRRNVEMKKWTGNGRH